MPALPIIANLVKVALSYALEGAVNAVTRHFLLGTTATGTSALNTAATNIQNAWKANMAPVTMPNTSLVLVEVEDLSSPTAGTGVWAGSVPGTISGGLNSPAGSAMIITNLLNLRQRGGHSRVFLPGMDGRIISPTDNGEWTNGGATNVLTAWQAYLTAVKGQSGNMGYSSMSHVTPHYYHGNHPYIDTNTNRAHNKPVLDPLGPQPYAIINNGFSLTIGTQSRRNH